MRESVFGWVRALFLGAAATSVVALLLLLIPHVLVTQTPGMSRAVRVGLATGWTAASVIVLLAGLVRFTRPSTRPAA